MGTTSVYANYKIDIRGINCGENDQMCFWLTKAHLNNWTHKVFLVDEASQLFIARNTKDLSQTELAKTIWQMPKKDTLFCYTSNPGSTVDKLIRDGTWYTIVTNWIERDPETFQPCIDLTVIFDYEHETTENLKSDDVEWIHNFFNSLQQVK